MKAASLPRLQRNTPSERPAPSLFDPRFIQDISEYCDRWCARCAHTSRCHHYAMGEAGHAFVRDHNERARTSNPMQQALEVDCCDRLRGLGRNWTDAEREAATAAWRQEEQKREARGAPLLATASAYENALWSWRRAATASVEGTSPVRETGGTKAKREALSEFIKVVSRYAHCIGGKLNQAMDSWVFDPAGTDEEWDSYPSCCNGKAKTALIAMDRSIDACEGVRTMLGSEVGGIPGLLGQLRDLRTETERFFPDARAFVRPGLDEGLGT